MEENKRNPRRSRSSGGKVAVGAAVLALLLAGGHFGLGIGRSGGGAPAGDAGQSAPEATAQSAQSTREPEKETEEKVQENVNEPAEEAQETAEASRDDGVLTVTVKEDTLLYEGQEVNLAQLEENLLKDYKAESTVVELKDDHAIKAAYDEVTALLERLNMPFTEGK